MKRTKQGSVEKSSRQEVGCRQTAAKLDGPFVFAVHISAVNLLDSNPLSGFKSMQATKVSFRTLLECFNANKNVISNGIAYSRSHALGVQSIHFSDRPPNIGHVWLGFHEIFFHF